MHKHSSRYSVKNHGFTGDHTRLHFINKYGSMNTKKVSSLTFRSMKTARWYKNERYKLLSNIPEYKTIKEACDVDLRTLEKW